MPENSMKAPEQIVPESLGDYLDVMSKSVFQERYLVEGRGGEMAKHP